MPKNAFMSRCSVRGSRDKARPLAEAGQGEIDQQVLAATPGDRLPASPASVIRGSAAKARFSEPNRSTTACAAGKLDRLRQPAELRRRPPSGAPGPAGFFQPQLGDAPPGQDLPATEAVGEELLAPGLILEQVEGADPGRDRLGLPAALPGRP